MIFCTKIVCIGSPHSALVYPSQQVVKVGQETRFMCDSQSIVRWKFMDGVLPHNAIVHGKLNRILMIINAQKSNQGAYRCDYKINNTKILKTDSGFLLVIGEYSIVTYCTL